MRLRRPKEDVITFLHPHADGCAGFIHIWTHIHIFFTCMMSHTVFLLLYKGVRTF